MPRGVGKLKVQDNFTVTYKVQDNFTVTYCQDTENYKQHGFK